MPRESKGLTGNPGRIHQNATSVHKKGGFYGQKYEMVASIQKKGCYLGRDVNSIVFGTVSRKMSADVSQYAGTLTHSILDFRRGGHLVG